MFFKILTITALVKICSGGAPTYPQENKSNQASYSQSFMREDVPLSYQYSAVHVYNPKQNQKSPQKKTESGINEVLPSVNFNKQALNPISYPGIQYAPIPFKREEHEHQNQNAAGFYTHLTSSRDYKQSEVPEQTTEYALKKPHLEPQLELSHPAFKKPQHQVNNQFVPGHNIQVLPSPNRSPVSNNYHKNIPQTQQEEPNVDNFLRHFTIRHESKQPVAVSTFAPKMIQYYTAITTESTKQPAFAFVPEYYNNYQFSYQPNDGEVQLIRQAQILQPSSPLAKPTKLQLNIARGHKVAQMPHQAHLNHGHFHSYPLHTEAVISPSIQKNNGHTNVTKLLPMPNQLHMSMYNQYNQS